MTVLPNLSVRENEEVNSLLEYRPFAKPVPEREVALAYRNSYPRLKLVNLLIDIIKECDIK